MRKTISIPKIFALITMLMIGTCNGASLVTDKFLRAVSLIESGGKANAVGDSGKAQGSFQFWRRTWEHTSAIRSNAGLPTYGYSAATNLLASRAYARTYLQWLEQGLKRNGCRNPTRGQIYAAFNCGLAGFKRRGFKLSRCPSHTQRAVERIEKLCR